MSQNKLKVLHIITRLDVGGSSTNTIETVARMNPSQYSSILLAGKTYDPDQSIERELSSRNIEHVYMNHLIRSIHPWHDVLAFCSLYQFIKKGQFDIVHTHTSKAGILGRWAAKYAGVKIIIHTPHGHVFYGYFGKLTTAIFKWIEKRTARITDRIITLTNLGKKEHVSFGIGPENKFVVIPSGIDVAKCSSSQQSRDELRKKLNIPSDAFIFGTVARLDPIKGNQYLIEAFRLIVQEDSRVHLILVGDGAERQELEKRVEQLGMQTRVHFVGFKKDVVPFLHLLDCFVLASLNEGMGRSVVEAMACGKPVIASRTGGIPELITDEVEGYLVGVQNTEQISIAMRKVLNNPQSSQMMGNKGRQKVSECFSLDYMIDSIDQLYQEVLKEKQL